MVLYYVVIHFLDPILNLINIIVQLLVLVLIWVLEF